MMWHTLRDYPVINKRYRPIELLGSGGMAEVYLAHDAVLDREVALKVLSRTYVDDDEVIERFRSEARNAASLRHPNIVSVYDRGETEDGTYYIVMEYLPGGTLKERILREGSLPPRTSAAAAIQVAEALMEAHRNDVIHRDVKPQNILITEEGDAKVADFGIARAASSATLTRTGVLLGSVQYMSPEQAIGARVGPRSDLYSLGVVLYEMLTGEPPYDAESPISVALKHVEGRLRPPRTVEPSIPEGMNTVTVRLLAKDPEERYPDAASLLEDLDRAGRGLSPTAATTSTLVGGVAKTVDDGQSTTPWGAHIGGSSPPTPRREKGRRRWIVPWLVAAALLVALVLIGAVGPSFWQDLRGPSEVPIVEASSLIEVPDVSGQGLKEAPQTLRDARLTVDAEHDTAKSDEPEGTVLGTDPPAGSEVEAGTSITVTVSRGASQERTTTPVLNAPMGTATPLETAATWPIAQQPAPAPTPSSVSSAPAPSSAPRQPDLEQGVEEWEQAPEDRNETQEEAQAEKGEIQERVHEAVEEIQEKVHDRVEKPREDRIGDDR